MLKGTGIFVDDDLSWKEREVQNIIRQQAKDKAEGKRVKIGYKKAWIGDEKWIWKNEKLVQENC